MDPILRVTGTALPLDRSDVDTDQIIPAEWLKQVERSGFGRGLFSAWRADPDFVLNRPEHAQATILVAGPNFGTGSSREHAVWALMDHGFRAVVSPRFGDIFRNNCTKVGLVPAQVEAGEGAALLAAVQSDPALEVTVDVSGSGDRGSLPPRRLHPLASARRPRRHRPHPAPPGRHRRLRVRPPGVDAGPERTRGRGRLTAAAPPLPWPTPA